MIEIDGSHAIPYLLNSACLMAWLVRVGFPSTPHTAGLLYLESCCAIHNGTVIAPLCWTALFPVEESESQQELYASRKERPGGGRVDVPV